MQSPRRRVGRNEPCPCGSGRKFKRCHGSSPDANPVIESSGPKASERLLELAAPWLDACEHDDAYLQCLRLTMTAWNLAVLEALGADTTDARAMVRDLGLDAEVDDMAKRKARLFPEDLRQIMDVVVTRDQDGGRYLKVATMR